VRPKPKFGRATPPRRGDRTGRDFAFGPSCAVAAKRTTSSIPIVFASGGDPVELGLVESLNRPGGNATGITMFLNELSAKRLEKLRELMPNILLVASIASDQRLRWHVRTTQIAAVSLRCSELALRANYGLMHRNKRTFYSISNPAKWPVAKIRRCVLFALLR
jgi:hypothetical protein